MPFESGEWKPSINLADRQQMNVAEVGAVIADIGQTFTDLARASRMAVGASSLPAGLTEARVAQMIADAIAKIVIPPATSTDLSPFEARLAKLEQAPAPVASADPTQPVDTAPLLKRIAELEDQVIGTRVALYRSIVASRQLSEASSLINQRNNVGIDSITEAEIGMASVLTSGNASIPRDDVMALAERIVSREQAWAYYAAKTPIDSPAALDAAISAYLGD